MRFIFYFVFFGLLFYIIWMYFPEAFQTLVSWAAKLYNFLYNLVMGIVDHVNSWAGTPHQLPEVPKTPTQG
jgi:hypothetical protein